MFLKMILYYVWPSETCYFPLTWYTYNSSVIKYAAVFPSLALIYKFYGVILQKLTYLFAIDVYLGCFGLFCFIVTKNNAVIAVI